jgi:hypothetical protein
MRCVPSGLTGDTYGRLRIGRVALNSPVVVSSTLIAATVRASSHTLT